MKKIFLCGLRLSMLLSLFCYFSLPAIAQEEETAVTTEENLKSKEEATVETKILKGKIEQVEIKEETEGKVVAKIKVRLLEGVYTGTSLYSDYTGDTELREGDEVFVKSTISDHEIQKIEFVGLNRAVYLTWLGIISGIILITIVVLKSPKLLTSSILLGLVVATNIFQSTINWLGAIPGTVVILFLIIILSNIINKGFSKFTLITALGGIGGVVVTAILQSTFSSAMRLPPEDLNLFNAGVLLATAGIIMPNAEKIVCDLKEVLKHQENTKREKILSEGISISRGYAATGINILFWCYIGLFLVSIITAKGETLEIGLFNNPQIAKMSVSILSSAVGVLLVPIITTILSFFIIDINKLGRRVPQKRQIGLNV